MFFSLILFVLSWLMFVFFARKDYFYQFSPTCYVASILGLVTDNITRDYGLWIYPSSSQIQETTRHFLNDFGIYIVFTYLFLQTLPKRRNFLTVTFHILLWTLPSIGIEYIAFRLGYIKYGLWWNIGYSYVADWILFVIFYRHHLLRVRHKTR